jgi:trigger factor
MAKIVSTKLEDELTLHVQCHVENQEYTDFSQRITEQYLKNVEVKGFRKGKVPLDIALKQTDPIKLNQLVLEESVQKFYKALQPEVTQYLKKEDRIPTNVPAQVEPESVKLEDDGFHFKVIIDLLPKIDLTVLDNLQVTTPDVSEAGERLSFEEFQAREEEKIILNLNEFEPSKSKSKSGYKIIADIEESIEGGEKSQNTDITFVLGSGQFPDEFDSQLLDCKVGDVKEFELNLPHGDHNHNYTFKVTIKEINQPKYTTVDDIFEKVEAAKSQFADKEAFVTFLHSIYDQETENILFNLSGSNSPLLAA